MFNLEEAISEWRRRMLNAGIQSPVPLEELEIHLRDEIEQYMKFGLREAEAFQAAVEKIGQAEQLQKEFKKVAKNPAIVRVLLLVIGWVVAGCTLAYSMVALNLDWNLFRFSPRWNLGVMVYLSLILAALTSIWFLAQVSRDKTSRMAALFVCLLLAVVWIPGLHSEEITASQAPKLEPQMSGQQAMGYVIASSFYRSVPSPVWYRGGGMLLLCMPGVIWVWWTRRHLSLKRSPTRGNQPIHSD